MLYARTRLFIYTDTDELSTDTDGYTQVSYPQDRC